MIENRSHSWDHAIRHNSCLIANGLKTGLLGPEIVYSPLQLGIEDLETWDWIRSAYVDWVKADPRTQNWCAN